MSASGSQPDLFGPSVAPRGVMSARAEASIPKAKNGSINADELNKPQKLTRFGVSKRPRPKSVFPAQGPAEGDSNSQSQGQYQDQLMQQQGGSQRLKMSSGTGEDTMPLPVALDGGDAVTVIKTLTEDSLFALEGEEDVSLSAAIEAMVRQVELTVKPNRSEVPATFSLQQIQDDLNRQEAERMGRYSREAEDDVRDQEVRVESYYAEDCFPVRSVMGFVTRNWRVPLKECELAFVVNGHWWRNTRFDTIDKLETFIRKQRPSRIEIGGIKHNTERFLVFDTDLEDAPASHAFIASASASTLQAPGSSAATTTTTTAPVFSSGSGAQLQGYIRNCACKGTRNMCSTGCWFYMVAAVKCLTYIAKNVFGAKYVLPVYSGRRGVHTWILDEKFVTKTSGEREAIVARIHALSKPHEYEHPEYTRYILEYILAPMFDTHILKVGSASASGGGGDGKTNLLACHETIELISRIVAEMRKMTTGFHNSREQGVIQAAACLAASDPGRAWSDLVNEFGPVFRARVIFALLFPRIDANVTTQMNHCIKAPFVIHPDTKRCSVPIPDIETWTPLRAPRLCHFVLPPADPKNKYGHGRGSYRNDDDDDGESRQSRARLEVYIAHMSRMIETAYPFADGDRHPRVYKP